MQLLKLPSFQHGIQKSNFSGAYIFGNKKKPYLQNCNVI